MRNSNRTLWPSANLGLTIVRSSELRAPAEFLTATQRFHHRAEFRSIEFQGYGAQYYTDRWVDSVWNSLGLCVGHIGLVWCWAFTDLTGLALGLHPIQHSCLQRPKPYRARLENYLFYLFAYANLSDPALYSCGFDHFPIMTTKPRARVRTRVNQTPAQHLCARVSISNCRRRLADCWSRRRVQCFRWPLVWPFGWIIQLGCMVGRSVSRSVHCLVGCLRKVSECCGIQSICVPLDSLSNTILFTRSALRKSCSHCELTIGMLEIPIVGIWISDCQFERRDKSHTDRTECREEKVFWPTTGHF